MLDEWDAVGKLVVVFLYKKKSLFLKFVLNPSVQEMEKERSIPVEIQ